MRKKGPSAEQIKRLTKYFKAQRYSEAKKLATLLTIKFPAHQYAWKALGAALGQMGRSAEAVVANRRSVELAPRDAL